MATNIDISQCFRGFAVVLTNCLCSIQPSLRKERRIMADARLHLTAGLPPETLRARARRRRETAERLWDDRLERLLLDEAEELERRADALELEAAIQVEESNAPGRTAQSDLAALREETKRH